MEIRPYPGCIEVITGPMFAGKSEELLRRLRRLDYAKKKYQVFKPAIDTRYSKNAIVSHIKNQAKAIPLDDVCDLPSFLTSDTEVVAIDEVEFFSMEAVEVCSKLANAGIRVIAAGLDLDYRGEPFPVVSALLAKAEDVTKLTAICAVCGAPATMTERLVDGKPAPLDGPTVLVGAAEAYEPRCRHCHQKGE